MTRNVNTQEKIQQWTNKHREKQIMRENAWKKVAATLCLRNV